MLKLILLFIAVPVVEIIIYIKLGGYIGVFPTLALILGTGIAGAVLAKQQGFYIINRIKQELQAGIVPGNQLLEGLLVLIGALLLLTPGLLTDMVGFILLLPVTRRYVREMLKRKLQEWIREGKVNFYFHLR